MLVLDLFVVGSLGWELGADFSSHLLMLALHSIKMRVQQAGYRELPSGREACWVASAVITSPRFLGVSVLFIIKHQLRWVCSGRV